MALIPCAIRGRQPGEHSKGVVCKGSAHQINMSPGVPVPEEVDVFKVPHLRMKGLVNDYFEMVSIEHDFVLI